MLAVPFLDFGVVNKASANPVIITDRPDLSISASAAYVNTQIQPAIRSSGIAKQATITLAAPNYVIIAAPVSIKVLGQSLQLNATTTMGLKVQNGRALLTIEKVDANGMSVPAELLVSYLEPLRAQGEDQLNRLVQRSLQGTGLRLANLRVAPEAITIDLSSR
ncbi:MAG: hypothetical protein HY782_21640 [Chloroflexi bacterium]|nr:hypothetical protein [Chloroflexota bacterium]